MSAKVEDLEKITTTLKINYEDTKYEEKSLPSIEKLINLEQTPIENVQSRHESLGEANGIKINNINNLTNISDNGNFKSASFGLPIKEIKQDNGFVQELRDEQVSKISGSNDIKLADKEKSTDHQKNLTSITNNGNSKSPSFDLPNEDIKQNNGFVEEHYNEQRELKISEDNIKKLSENEKSHNCSDECKCKIKQALELIVEEIKKIDAIIIKLKTPSQCPYTPKPEEKKEFAKSVQKNASVCHVIIGELKKQRTEINDMMKLYEESRRDFSKMEAALNHQHEKIQKIEAMLTSIEETVNNVKYDIAVRQDDFQFAMKKRRTRVETREEILRVFLNWISSLDAKRYEEQEASDLRLREATEERNMDRAMLTLAIKQLQEVKKIETLLMTQRAAMTQGRDDRLNVPITETQRVANPISSCGCSSPINRVAVISGQCAAAQCDRSRGRYFPEFDTALTRCVGGSDGFGTTMQSPQQLRVNENLNWNSQMPFTHPKNVRGPRIYHRHAVAIRRHSPSNNSRRYRKQKKNMQNTTEMRHCI